MTARRAWGPLVGALTSVVLASACGAHPSPTAAAAASSGARTTAPSETVTTPSGSATSTTTKPATVAAPPGTRHTSAVGASGSGELAPVPLAAAEPTERFPANAPAVGLGANAAVLAIPDSLWARMVGVSWTPGCPVGRSQLRYVGVNFWGFDGKRSRGGLVVNASIAGATAAVFTQLYTQQFRIRQLKPMDASWGRNPKGPGANDYAAMSADNSSAFNCRYVGGQEASRVYSKHAYGTAVDVNDFENPYVADDGTVYPQRYFLVRRGPAPGVFSSSSSPAVQAFTTQGFHWGGLWSKPDYQHFEQ